MAVNHAQAGQIIDVQILGERLRSATTKVLARSDRIEIIRMIMLAGKEFPAHQIPNPMTVQCLEGHVSFFSADKWQGMEQGQMLFLESNAEHALRAIEDSSLLITIHLPAK